MPPLTFDDLIPAAPAGGAELTPADHAAFALQQRAMTQAQGTPAAGAADPGAPYVLGAAPARQPAPAADPGAAFPDAQPPATQPQAHQPGVSFAAPATAAPATNAGPFDDLIPKQPSARSPGPVTFDDLVPSGSSSAANEEDDDPMTRTPATWADTGAAVGKAAHYTDDVVRLLANGATFGLADKAAGATISTPQQEAARTAAAQQNTGTVGKVAGIAGAVAPAAAGGGLVGAGAEALEGVPALGRLFGNSIVQGTATGAGLGATDAAVNGKPVSVGATLGALGGLGGASLGSAVGGTVRGIGGLFADAPNIPTSAALGAARDQAYTAADNAGLVYSPEAIARLRGAVQDHMADFGYAPELQPGGAAVLRALDRGDGMPMTLTGLDTIRKTAGNMYSPLNPSSGTLGRGIKGVIDDFTANPRPGDIMMGDQAAGVDALTQARTLNQAASKDEGLSEALDRAQDNAGASGSGGNINNAVRQQIKQLQNSRGDWTPDEQDALTNVIRGTRANNLLRQVGKLSPEGNGLMQRLDLLGAAAGYGTAGTGGAIAGAALPAAGFLAKRAADAATVRGAVGLGDLFRVGGDRAALTAAPNALQQFGASATRPITATALGALYAPSPGQLQVYNGLPPGAH